MQKVANRIFCNLYSLHSLTQVSQVTNLVIIKVFMSTCETWVYKYLLWCENHLRQ